MKSKKIKKVYIAFLRGINVGGHHKVPMTELKLELEKLGFENIITLLNSGNIIFDAECDSIINLEKKISENLENFFGFPIPTLIRESDVILNLLNNDPFKDIKITKDIRLYISFLQESDKTEISLPWKSPGKSFDIIEKRGKAVLSVLDLSVLKTPKAMEDLEKFFGKNITTRNWNTIKRIEHKLKTIY